MAQRRETGFRLRPDVSTFTGLHWLTIGLLAITGINHLYLFMAEEFLPFLFAGLGFFGIVAVLFVGLYRRLVYLAAIPFTISQIVGWYVLDGNLTSLAIFDKAVQVLLIVLLAYLFWKEGKEGVPLW